MDCASAEGFADTPTIIYRGLTGVEPSEPAARALVRGAGAA